MRLLLLLLFTFSFIQSSKPQANVCDYFNFDNGKYDVGYHVETVYDNARTFGGKINYFGKTLDNNNRQIKIHLWYPTANNSPNKAITIREYIEESALGLDHIPNESDKYEKLNKYINDLYMRDIDPNSVEKFIELSTNAFLDLALPKEKFPLIIYAPSINSDPFENFIIIEFLVSYGYVVVSASSIGFNTPEVSRDTIGAITQIEDLEFLLNECWNYDFIDKDNILTLGFSWGGMTSVLLAMKNRNIKGIVSFDGALGFDENFTIGLNCPFYKSTNLTASFLEFVSANDNSNSNFFDFIDYADASLVKVNNIKHKDFTSDAILKKVCFGLEPDKSKCKYLCNFYSELAKTTLSFFNQVIEHQNNYLIYNDWMRDVSEQVEIIHKKKISFQPTEQEFLAKNITSSN